MARKKKEVHWIAVEETMPPKCHYIALGRRQFDGRWAVAIGFASPDATQKGMAHEWTHWAELPDWILAGTTADSHR
jgi:hypothetical protein